MSKYYKVVLHSKGEYSSVIAYGRMAVIYSKTEVIKPDIGKLFVFTCLDSAKKWGEDCATGLYEIWEVAVTRPQPAPQRLCNILWNDIVKCWRGKKYLTPTTTASSWKTPINTCMVSSVKYISTVCKFNTRK